MYIIISDGYFLFIFWIYFSPCDATLSLKAIMAISRFNELGSDWLTHPDASRDLQRHDGK